MNGLPYYKAYPRDFIEGTIGMPFEVKGAYRLVLDLIYMQGGNLPDDARYISGLLGCTIRKWKSLRDELLQDGKLELNGEFLTNKRAVSELKILAKLQENQRENRSRPNKNKHLASPPSHHTEPEPDNTSSLRSEGKARAPKPSSGFAEFWNLYPNKVGKPVAEKAFSKALQRSDLQTIMAGLHRYVSKTDDRPWCNPSTWLNQDRWADAPVAVPARSTGPPQRERTILDAIDDFIRTHDDELPAGKTIDHYGGNSPANVHLLAHAQRGRR